MASAVPRSAPKVIRKQPPLRPSFFSEAKDDLRKGKPGGTISGHQTAIPDPGQKYLRGRRKNAQVSFWRGGTSKGVFIPRARLPNNLYPLHLVHREHRSLRTTAQWNWRRHIESEQSVLYQKAHHDEEVDVEYTFVQVGVEDGKLDLTGNCGNLTSVMGPLALDEKLFVPSPDRFDHSKAVQLVADTFRTDGVPVMIRLRNTNTRKIIHATFMATVAKSNASHYWHYQPAGRYAIDGVPGTGSKISLKFIDPGGSKTGKVLPTGHTVDILETDQDTVRASLIDITNPGIFIAGAEVGWDPSRNPEELNANTELMTRLEAIRKKGTELMGLDSLKYKATPKIVLVYPSDSDSIHIRCQALSMEKAHKAVPGTLALNLGAACKIPGTLPYELARRDGKSQVVIGHPSGKAEVGAEVDVNNTPTWVELGRTARCLMEGFVNTSTDHEHDLKELPLENNTILAA